MDAVTFVLTRSGCGYLWRRCRSAKMIVLILTLGVTLILFISFTHSSLRNRVYTPLVWHAAKIEASNSTDRYVHITIYPILSTFFKESQNDSDNCTTEPIKLNQGNDTVIYKKQDGCTFSFTDPFHPAVMARTRLHKPISCKDRVPHLVYQNGNTIQVDHLTTSLPSRYKFKECRYKSIAKKPGSDFMTVVLYTSPPFNDSITLRDSDDNLVVECYGNKNTVLSRSYFSLIRVKPDLELLLEENFKKHVTLNAPKEVFNILMIGIDGTSKQNFQRHMPKTRNFLLNVLNATELHKYNKMGLNTLQNLVPLLTGKPWVYLYQRNWTDKTHFDVVNDDFLWSDYHKAGYRTGLLLDDPEQTAFHYEKLGWDKPPVDYYVRATILELARDKLMRDPLVHCVGDVPEITFNHDFWIQMASTFNNSQTKPFFGFSFSGRLTHDDLNMASAGDDLYLDFLQKLKDKNVTNNTVIIFFSDHGARFGPIPSSYQGQIEARTPFVFLIFPPWFHQKYPDLMKVLKINQERLTTNTDIYETMRYLLNFQAETRLGDINKTGISLFYEIPRERTCDHIGIEVQFCGCSNFQETNVSTDIAVGLTVAVQDKLRQLVLGIREKCEELAVESIESILISQPNSANERQAAQSAAFYRIILTVKPGAAMYEATIQYSKMAETFKVIGDVNRLNLYRGQTKCINDAILMPFCFCKQ